MRCYVHYEDTTLPFTLLVTLSEQQLNKCTVSDLIQLFLTKYRERHPTISIETCPQKWSLAASSRKSVTFPHNELVWKKVRNKDDLNIFPCISVAVVSHPSNERCSLLLSHAEKYCAEQNYQKAVQVYKNLLREDPSNRDTLLGLIDIYLKVGRNVDALHHAKEAFHHHSDDVIFLLKLGHGYLGRGDGAKAVDYLMRYSKELRKKAKVSSAEKYQLQVSLCQAYQLLNQTDMAIVVIEGVLRETKDFIPAVVEYSKLTFDLGEDEGENAMVLLLSAIVNDRENKEIQHVLALLAKKPQGMQLLEKASGEAWSSVAAILFLATILRDDGALREACVLVKRAFELSASSASSLLLNLHLMEVLGQYNDCLSSALVFLQTNSALGVAGVECRHIAQYLCHLTSSSYLNQAPPSPVCSEPAFDRTCAYSEDEHQLLAAWCTIIKVLFLQGCLPSISPLVALLDPLIKDRNLYKTNIRNEVAYYDCIHNALSISTPPSVSENSSFIYFVGDSHCISPAWRAVHCQDSDFTLHPVLSTGTKIWHLRPQSMYYPKDNFFNSVEKIPSKAIVVLCLGEIDCREALIRCVEKCIYDVRVNHSSMLHIESLNRDKNLKE